MDQLFAAAGSLREAYARVDWAATPLGPVASWSPATRAAVDLALRTRFPVTLFWGPEFVMIYNEAYVHMIADKHPAALGQPAAKVFAEIWDEIGPMLAQASSGGGATWVEDLRLDMRRHGFLEETYFTFSYSPVVGADGRVEGVFDIATETTTQVVSRRRLQLLNALQERLASVDHRGEVLARAMPVLHADPDDLPGVEIVAADGHGDVAVRDTPEGRVATVRLSTRGRATGDLMLRTELSPRLAADGAYLIFVRLVGATLTQALDRARLREAERRVAAVEREISETLQRSLLTPPPDTDEFQIAARYEPAQEHARIGGDWYDAFLLPDGTLTMVVGDISGHDRYAAATMGQVRNMLRGIAHTLLGPPSRILAAMDEAMAGLGIDTFATVVLAQVGPAAGTPAAHSLRWCNAGHPPPILLAPDGTATLLRRRSELLLGTGLTAERSDHEVALERGSHVAFYTDGLVERPGASMDASMRELAGLLTGRHHLSAEQLCDHLLTSSRTGAADDIVITVLQTGAVAPNR
ncbi:PP2C family protein-serine/threonine phosphatase [Dactylosporangium sp. CS-033363]|uniref:PP2C family protein-serine/threonine phosphatase n=1 Tax=Dactylosporangium sp. CS-033363 TaxID=3239935 RepID=UPI003D94E2D0